MIKIDHSYPVEKKFEERGPVEGEGGAPSSHDEANDCADREARAARGRRSRRHFTVSSHHSRALLQPQTTIWLFSEL